MLDACMFKFALEVLKPWSCDMQPVGPMQDICPVWQMCSLDPGIQCTCLGNATFLLSMWK